MQKLKISKHHPADASSGRTFFRSTGLQLDRDIMLPRPPKPLNTSHHAGTSTLYLPFGSRFWDWWASPSIGPGLNYLDLNRLTEWWNNSLIAPRCWAKRAGPMIFTWDITRAPEQTQLLILDPVLRPLSLVLPHWCSDDPLLSPTHVHSGVW